MRARAPARLRSLVLVAALGLATSTAGVGSAALPWDLPPPGTCEPEGGLRALGSPDAPPAPFARGQTFSVNELELLRAFLPAFIWEYRERFFYEGMRLEIGDCFADYSPPSFFQAATQRFAGRAKLTEEDGLEGYEAGLPFPASGIDAAGASAGFEWAWNFEMRYQGAGFWGKFRTTDMVGRDGRGEPFLGEIFKAQTAFRSDRAKDEYRAPGARGKHWVAGGLLFEPFDARHYAWRQYRDVEHMTEPARTDDVHAYLPDFRRVRRVAAADVEGLYMPSFSVGVVKPTVISADGGGGVGGIGAAPAVGTIATKRSGFEGLEIRPLLHEFRLLGVQDVLTPINARTPSYPADAEREFGPWGLSFASDSWDLRRAVVLEGRAKKTTGGDSVARFIMYVDAQSLAPLYYASWDGRGEQIDVGMHVGRWSEARADYPSWPGAANLPVRAVDSVGASWAHVLEDGGWRRESWEIVSTPPKDNLLKRTLSVNDLTKRR